MNEFRRLKPSGSQDIEAAARLVGIPQLRRIFDLACEVRGGIPPISDADDVLKDPPGVLGRFCKSVGMAFDPDRPIQWSRGKHKHDGAWADAWYQKIYETTGLGTYKPRQPVIPPELQPVVDYCMPTYDHLAQFKIT